MGRAQTANGPSLDPSGSPDRFADQFVFDKERVFGNQWTDTAGTCGVLPAFAAPAPANDEKKVSETDQGLMLGELWYQLPKDEQVRFGGCFSRMILKILNRYDGCKGEGDA
ncbi:MAG: hypothetical protein EHM80_00210 [Nitrospiraceae bacterium]|nr:MAG: hypothetical protein EHM80_05275 [Nitrospiraceae bacterium]RPH82098.1 MAG: hypothetical protein EHM80_00210 [Nitrospiraceae bacterium]